MYTIEQIIEQLAEKLCYVEVKQIKEFFKVLKIEAIYEDENGKEFFEDSALAEAVKNFCSNDNSIIKTETTPTEPEQNFEGAKLTKINLDVTNQTLAIIADSIATKVTKDITDHLKQQDFLSAAIDAGEKKRDNEILARQVEKLIEENTRLISKVNKLQKETESFKQVFGTVYIKTI